METRNPGITELNGVHNDSEYRELRARQVLNVRVSQFHWADYEARSLRHCAKAIEKVNKAMAAKPLIDKDGNAVLDGFGQPYLVQPSASELAQLVKSLDTLIERQRILIEGLFPRAVRPGAKQATAPMKLLEAEVITGMEQASADEATLDKPADEGLAELPSLQSYLNKRAKEKEAKL
jgi:hypothetical protein